MKDHTFLRQAPRIICIVIFMAQMTAFAQVPDSALKFKIDSMILKEMVNAKAAGVAIGVVRDGKIWYNNGYGSKAINTICLQKPTHSFSIYTLQDLNFQAIHAVYENCNLP